jgi:hypothetical protein
MDKFDRAVLTDEEEIAHLHSIFEMLTGTVRQ